MGGELLNREVINTILFDLDGTLRENKPTVSQALTHYTQRLGIQSDNDSRRSALRWLHYYWAQSPELMEDAAKFGDYGEPFWVNHSRLFLLAHGCSPDQAAELAPSLYHCMHNEYKPEDSLNGKVAVVLGMLQKGGYRLGVLSNRTEPFDEQLDELGIGSYFEYYLAAGTIDTWKPDPAIFQHAVDELGIKPGQVVYIGDNYFADVIGASRAGVQPVLIDPEALFPEADCPVIENISQLPSVLEN